MNQPTCPLCSSHQAKREFVKFNYPLFVCGSCQSLYVYPSPSFLELEDYYKKTEGEQLSTVCWTETLDSHRHILDVWKQALDYIQRLSGRGPLLDVGCGTGQFLSFAKNQRWTDLTGIELVPEVAEKARQLSGAVIYSTDLITASLPTESFNGIILGDVIEHLSNVQAMLKEAFRLLKPGGVIFISTVHRHGFSIRLLNQNALTVNPPEHLIFFTQKGMYQALHNAGFEVKKQWSFSIYIREWINFLSRFKPNKTGKYKSDTNYASEFTQSKLFIILMKITNFFLAITNLGDELVAIGQKPTFNK